MNKGELIDAVAAELNTSKADAARAVDAVLGCIASGLKADEKVTLVGFGTFQKRVRAARTGMNPVTRAPIEIKASKTCGFRPSVQLKGAL